MQKTCRWLVGVVVAAMHAVVAAAPAHHEIVLVRGDENYPPFEMVVGGKLKGIHIEMVEAAGRSINLRITWQSLPWRRALRMVETGKADGITYIGRTTERENWATFADDNVLSTTEVRFVVLQSSAQHVLFDGNLANFLATRQPIVIRGFAFGLPELDKRKNFEADNMADLVRQLQFKVSDVGVVNWSDFSGAFFNKPEMALVSALKPAIKTNDNYIAFSKAGNHANLAEKFGKALANYKTTEAYTALLKRYRLERE
jgi:polar amino acid transport system substrate-binding protein